MLLFYYLIVLKNLLLHFLHLQIMVSPKISRSSFISSNSFFPIKTSPRTIILIFSFNFLGMFFIVFRFSVTSSPTSPFPLVAPLTNSPFLYSRLTDNPSIFVSTTNFGFFISYSFAFFYSFFKFF